MTSFRRPLVAANWKMNCLKADGLTLAREVAHRARQAAQAGLPAGAPEIVVCPPATLLFPIAESLAGSDVRLGGQDCHAKPSGAATGDIAAPMLKDAGCAYVIVGHSERRAGHGEGDETVQAKAEAARAAGLAAILCLGETAAEREGGRAVETVLRQLEGSLPHAATPETLAIAYEPVWAIGTGRTPTLQEIGAMHGELRARLERLVRGGRDIRILYGGSVKGSNAAQVLALDDVDGALVGGASLDAAEFWRIVEAAPRRG